jgi:hypothetical protein
MPSIIRKAIALRAVSYERLGFSLTYALRRARQDYAEWI